MKCLDNYNSNFYKMEIMFDVEQIFNGLKNYQKIIIKEVAIGTY
jgi:hypothetical protein